MKTKKSIVCFFLCALLVEDNILYEKFLQWLLDVDNYELFIRIKKFVSSINSILPPSDPYNREEQYALNPPIRARTMKIARDIRVFVNEALSGIDLSDDQKQLYPRYLRKLIMVMCYSKVGCFVRLGRKILACLPGYKPEKKDYFLGRCRALSQFITFQNLGHDNRHTVAQYKEFWDCAIERCASEKDLMDRAASDVGVSVCRR